MRKSKGENDKKNGFINNIFIQNQILLKIVAVLTMFLVAYKRTLWYNNIWCEVY